MQISERNIKVPYVNFAAQWQEEREYLMPIIERVMASGQYIGGQYVDEFEHQAARLCQAKHCVALNSGTDALILGLKVLGVGPGDEVITPPNSFVASTAAIIHVGARPVFVDVLPDQNIDPDKIESAITKRTKAIMPVHLTGRMAKMDRIKEIADRHGLAILEDAAQAIGSKYLDIPTGKWGNIGCFSTHPLKNLNAAGDGGFLVTDDDDLAHRVKLLRSHGLLDRNTVLEFGTVSRMDALQAAILSFRLNKLPQVIAKRRENASLYRELLPSSHILVPQDAAEEFNTYHTFVIQIERRDDVQNALREVGIETSIHYPVPIHLQPAAAKLGYSLGEFPVAERQAKRILTLPINQYLTPDDIRLVSSYLDSSNLPV